MKNKGFTLVELTIGMGIFFIILASIATTYVTTQKLWKGGFTQIFFQSRGRIVLDEIARNLRSATLATVLSSGARIRFVIDPNRTPGTLTDDITCEYYISGTDLIHDPDISSAGDEVTLLPDIYQEPAIPFFQISGNLVVITFKLYNSSVIYGAHWSSMSTSVKLRNI